MSFSSSIVAPVKQLSPTSSHPSCVKRSKLTELVKSLQQPLPMVSFSSLHGNVLRSSILVTFTPYCCCGKVLWRWKSPASIGKVGVWGVLEMEKEAGLMRKELSGMSSHERLGVSVRECPYSTRLEMTRLGVCSKQPEPVSNLWREGMSACKGGGEERLVSFTTAGSRRQAKTACPSVISVSAWRST